MNLAEYDHVIGFHLKMLRFDADSCLYHVNQIKTRPNFETLAMDDLQRLKTELLAALESVMQAQARYQEKPIDADAHS